MENLNAVIVKKALECCSNWHSIKDCEKCPLNNNGCVPNALEGYALSLITSQEQRLKELTEENERLREDNEIKSQKRANIFEIANAFERGRTDGVRKMLQRIKEDAVSVSLLSNPPKFMLEIREDALDQIAKEMLESDDG